MSFDNYSAVDYYFFASVGENLCLRKGGKKDLAAISFFAGLFLNSQPDYTLGIDESDTATPLWREIQRNEKMYFLLLSVPNYDPTALALLAKDIAYTYIALQADDEYGEETYGFPDEKAILERALIWANKAGLRIFESSLQGKEISDKLLNLYEELDAHHSKLIRGDSIL